MDHSEALQQMATEKYLLNELSPEERSAFERHFFECDECTYDLEAAAAFLDEAEAQLPAFAAVSREPIMEPAPQPNPRVRSQKEDAQSKGFRFGWAWLRPLFASPAFAGPVFAALALVIGYQNLVTFPALRIAATEPRLVPSLVIHPGARGGATRSEAPIVDAGRKLGASFLLDPAELAPYPAYRFDLYDPQGKLAWTQNLAAPAGAVEPSAQTDSAARVWTLSIPGAGLSEGLYTLAISGADAAGNRTEIARKTFQIHVQD